MAPRFLYGEKAVLIDFNTIVDSEFLSAHALLKVIGSNTTGMEHINSEECEKRGIKVTTLGLFPRDTETEELMKTVTSTAEFTFLMLLGLFRTFRNAKLYGKTLGIVGLGRIGKMVKGYAEAFGMKVLAYDVRGGTKLDTVLRESDAVTIHIPLEKNEGFIDKYKLKKLKPTAFLINTSRTNVVNSKDLIWALRNKKITAAAVDFMDDKELIEYAKENKNLILTDHVAGGTIDDRKLTEDFICKKMKTFLVKS